jgi:hypothetical protein
LALSVVLGLAGCCYTVNAMGNPASANLTVSDPTPLQISMVMTSFGQDISLELGNPPELGAPCLVVQDASGQGFSGTIDIDDCPAGSGSFQLTDLKAEVCDQSFQSCAAITGTLNVHAFTPTCGHGACGHIEADLSIDNPATPNADGGPTVSGTATLSASETKDACNNSPFQG